MISLVLYGIVLVAQWFVYQKMGREGWEGILPLYNMYVLFEVLYGNGWKLLTLFIPFYNIYVACKLWIDLAYAFNKSAGFGWGLILLPSIFMPILGFSKDIKYGDGSYDVNVSTVFGSKNSNTADLLLKYKELLDMDAITQEEYEKKKKELLG